MSSEGEEIRDAVRERYGRLARTASGGSCCQPTSDCCGSSQEIKLYSEESADGALAGSSLGCGDPVTIAGLEQGETILDLGSGAGLDCFRAAGQVGASGRVIGVDMTPEMISLAEANRSKLGLRNVEFRQGTIERLPVDDGSIDVIISNCVINLAPDKAPVFQEAFRVLKPGGRVSISDIVIEGEFTPDQRADMDSWAECIAGAIDVRQYLSLMSDAGLVDARVVNREDYSASNGSPESSPRIYSARITAYKPRRAHSS
jgi:SAM-dependent methyltransferase